MASTPGNINIPTLFLANWTENPSLSGAWQTGINVGQTDDETRRGLTDRPARVARVRLTGLSDTDYDPSAICELVEAMARDRVLVPLWMDHVELTIGAINGMVALDVSDTANKRFYVGMKVYVAFPSAETPVIWDYEVRTIAGVAANLITLDPLTQDWPVGARIYPCMRAEVVLSAGVDIRSVVEAEGTLEFREIYGTETLPAMTASGTLPIGEQTFAGIPILAIPYDGRTLQRSVQRQGSLAQVGLDNVPDLYGPDGRVSFELTYTGEDRHSSIRPVKFFDSRGGRLYPLWFASPVKDVIVKAMTVNTITAKVNKPTLSDATRRIGRHLCLVKGDGSTSVHRITAVAEDVDDQVVFTLATNINLGTFGIGKFTRCAWCYLCRFDSDELEETYLTDEISQCSVKLLQLRNNGDAEELPNIPDIPDPRTGDDPLDPWVPDDGCNAPTAVTVPMFFNPGESLLADRDAGRPIMQAADYLMPQFVKLVFNADGLFKDVLHSEAALLTELMASLAGTHQLEYDDGIDENAVKSRHWRHIRVKDAGLAGMVFDAPALGVTVNRRVWRKQLSYDVGASEHQLEIRFVAEWNPAAIPGDDGAWGTLFHVYVFSDEINGGYVDGTLLDVEGDGDPLVGFTREDPCVTAGPLNGHYERRYAHPSLALIGCVPTTWEAPIGHTWYPPNFTSTMQVTADDAFANTRASCFNVSTGCPWCVKEDECTFEPRDTEGAFTENLDRLILLGVASIGGVDAQELVLTPAMAPYEFNGANISTRGAAWYYKKLNVTDSWETTFKFNIYFQNPPGADGFAFVIQNDRFDALGGRGGNMGYGLVVGGDISNVGAGVSKSIAVEFDTYFNNEYDDSPGQAHISVQTRFADPNSPEDDYSLGSVQWPELVDGNIHSVRIQYDSVLHKLKVYLDGSMVSALSVDVDMSTVIDSGTDAWVGFSAGSGTGYEQHEIYEWTYKPNGYTVTYGQAYEATGNNAFGASGGLSLFNHGFAAVTFGGGCKTSSIFEWVCVDRAPGLTALNVHNHGWDYKRGGKLLTARPTVSLTVCSPAGQPEMDCCPDYTEINDAQGSLVCFQNPVGDFQQCCVNIYSAFATDVTTQIYCDTDCYADDGVTIISHHEEVCGGETKHFNFVIDEVHRNQGADPDDGWIEWRYIDPDPSYVSVTKLGEDFSDGTLDDWGQSQSTWVNSAMRARVTGVTNLFGMLYLNIAGPPDALFKDGKVNATVQGDPNLDHAVGGRFDGDKAAYVGIKSKEFRRLEIRKYWNDFGTPRFKTLAARENVSATVLGDKLQLVIQGDLISFTHNDDENDRIFARDCEYTEGYFGPVALAVDAMYDDVDIEDIGPSTLTAVIRLDKTGWHFDMPANMTPQYYEQDALCTGTCTPPFNGSCHTLHTVYPGHIAGNQGVGSVLTVPLHAPWIPPGPCSEGVIIPLYEAVQAQLVPLDDSQRCPEADEACAGFSIWFRSCAAIE